MTLVVALSDLHLGDEASVANAFEQVPPRVAEARLALPEAPAFDTPGAIRARLQRALERSGGPLELVLHGDVFDLSNASPRVVLAQGRAFFERLLDGLSPARVTFVPGNHDHHLWTVIADERAWTTLVRDDPGVVDPLFLRTPFDGWPLDGDDAATELLRAVFPPAHRGVLRVAYPVYRKDVAGRTLVFLHGHHADTSSAWPGRFLLRAGSLEEIEAFTSGWVELMFHGLKQAGRLTALAHKTWAEIARAKRALSAATGRARDHADVAPGDGARDVGPALARLLELARRAEPLPAAFETVFGHTHRYCDGALGPHGLVFNTGGWLATHPNAERQTRLFLADDRSSRAELVCVPPARFARARALDEAWRKTTRLAFGSERGTNDGSVSVSG